MVIGYKQWRVTAVIPQSRSRKAQTGGWSWAVVQLWQQWGQTLASDGFIGKQAADSLGQG